MSTAGHVLPFLLSELLLHGWRSEPPSNAWFLGPIPESISQAASRSVQPLLQGSDRDRQTDNAAPSVAISRIYVVVLPGERNNARNTQAKKTTHGLDRQHQVVDRTLCGRVNQNGRG